MQSRDESTRYGIMLSNATADLQPIRYRRSRSRPTGTRAPPGRAAAPAAGRKSEYREAARTSHAVRGKHGISLVSHVVSVRRAGP